MDRAFRLRERYSRFDGKRLGSLWEFDLNFNP